MDALSRLVLTVDELSAEDAAALKAWIEPIVEQIGV